MQIADAPQKSGMTIIEICADYMDHCDVYYRDLTGKPTRGIERIKKAVSVLNEHYKTLPATDFGPLKLRAVQPR